jgi:hypothetical protein
MQLDAQAIDRIVTRVLNQLSANGSGVASAGGAAETQSRRGRAEESIRRETSPSATGSESIAITAHVVTAAVLLSTVNGASRVTVPDRAIITPSAWDIAKQRRIEIVRTPVHSAAQLGTAAKRNVGESKAPLLVIVRHTDAVARLWDDLKPAWRREVLGCPDDAAALATSAICRGESAVIVILAEQAHRAACFANRNERVKAVVVRDAGEVREIQTQLRANVWCIDPSKQSWFELRNLMRAVVAREGAS